MEKLKINIVNEDLLEMRKSYLKTVKECGFFDDFIKDNEISDEEIIDNMSKFLKVLEELESCNGCKDVNLCKKSTKGICLSLFINSEGEIDYTLKACKKYEKTLKLNHLFLARDFDENNLNYEFKDLLNQDFIDSRKKLIKELTSVIKNDSDIGVYLFGSRQCGKTFMMSVFAKTYIEKNKKSVAYLDSPIRIREINDLFFTNKEVFNEELTKLMNVDVLILDDFGNEYKNEIVRDNIIFPLLNERLRKHLLTCFISNYSLYEIGQMYALKEMKNPKSNQLVEMIKLMSKEIKIDSIPFRK